MLAVKLDSGKVVLVEVPEPTGSGVLVRVRACGICGSDVTILDSGFSIQGIPGHEIAGELEDGTPVAIEPIDPCGRCRYCDVGDYQVCEQGGRAIYGVSRDGGMAEWIRVPERCLVSLPRGVDASTGFLVEPLAVAIHGLRRGGIEKGMRVLVVGGGTIGLCAVVAAAAADAEVGLVARHPAQIAAGRVLGAEIVESIDNGEYDLVVDGAGSTSATLSACEALRPNGRLIMLAPSWETIELPGLLVLAKELDLIVSKMYGRGSTQRDIDVAASILAGRGEIPASMITHRFPLEDAAHAFDVSRDRSGGAIKVVLEP
jgi:threonine dehydrogenase-like Zn-dependent dehydrogenase